MSARIVPLRSAEAEDSRVQGTPAERVALVAQLSREAWSLTGRPVPVYTRANMPFRLITLRESGRAE